MNDHTHDDLPDPALQARLRALPLERVPPARVWEQIAAQLPAPAVASAEPTSHARRSRRRWPLRVGLGLAAGLAVLMVVPTAPPPAPAPAANPLQQQADVIASEYQQAIATLPTGTVGSDWQPTLHELDSSAASIRAAIAENPRSRYLLGQLQRTYSLRLELTQQALSAAGLPS
ncbi:anti-sigma factor [Stenotrophomonas sp. PS02289]|uniref:anti-sigma factor n=1 Tax=Stenotrophomonas sp. PS02289 TaxID=2991422 RepID=UPI00249AEA8F|nr:anti-sigma factor [Stenotrophomonas sp. PS02289]